MILLGTLIFMRFLVLSGVTNAIIDTTIGLPVSPAVKLVAMLAVMLVLGCFVPVVGVLSLTVPLFVPAADAFGFNLIWFGVLVIRMCELGLITPPVGVNVYAVKSVVPDVPITDIFKGTFPFLFADIINVILLVAIPSIALFIPNTMR